MSRITLSRVASLINAPTTINGILSQLESAFDRVMFRDGTTSNEMSANLDMNSKRVLNLPAPVSVHEPARMADVNNILALVKGTIPTDGGVIPAAAIGGLAESATTNTTNASNITSGYLAAARLASGAAESNLGFTPLNRGSNLSDLTNVATAKSNLGLASVATSGSASDITVGTLPLAVMPPEILSGNSTGKTFATSAAGVDTGLSVGVITSGTGASNGTYNVTIAATGGGTNAVIAVTNTSNVLTASVTSAGSNFTSQHTISNADLVAAGFSGLTGASIVLEPNGGVGFNQFFWVVSSTNGVALDLYKNVAGVATAQNRSIVDGESLGTTSFLGVSSPSTKASSVSSDQTMIWATPAAVDSTLESVQCYFEAGKGGPGEIYVLSINGSNVITSSAITKVFFQPGLNTVTVNMPVSAGQYIGIRTDLGGLVYDTVGPIGALNFAGKAGVGGTVSAWPFGTLQIKLNLATGHRAELDIIERTTALVGDIRTIGPTPANTGVYSTVNYTFFLAEPSPLTGSIKKVSLYSQGGPLTIYVATLNSSNVITNVSGYNFVVPAGYCELPLSIPVTAGQRIGILMDGTLGTNGLAYSTTAPASSGYITTVPAIGGTVTEAPSWVFQMKFEIRSGVSAEAVNDPASLNTFELADASGVSDSSQFFINAKAASPTPFLKPGVYAASSVPDNLSGFYGPGRPVINGVRYALPPYPLDGSLRRRARSRLAQTIYSSSALILIGDSITHFAYASTGSNQWTNLATRYLNAGIVADEPILVNFDNAAGYTPSFYGVTLSGSHSFGVAGPIIASLILQPGAAITFTGAYERIGCTYQRTGGSGSLVYAANGTPFHTETCSGATDSDHSGFVATGQATSKTYTITCSGANVEISSLLRDGIVNGAASETRLRVLRAAHSGYRTSEFNTTQINSALKIATAAGGGSDHSVIIGLGTNDGLQGYSYATVKANAQSIVSNLVAGGVKAQHIHAWLPWRFSGQPAGSLVQTQAALREAYEGAGINIIPTDAFDLISAGLGSDGHPNDDGQDLMFRTMMLSLAGIGLN